MKQNQKGFTLIELLAVIVILAIIALIATPIILGVVNDARKGASKDGAFGAIKAVQLAYTEALTKETNVPDEVTFTFTAGTPTPSHEGTYNISISGDKPESGTIKISSNGEATAEKLKIGNYCWTGSSELEEVDCQKDD